MNSHLDHTNVGFNWIFQNWGFMTIWIYANKDHWTKREYLTWTDSFYTNKFPMSNGMWRFVFCGKLL